MSKQAVRRHAERRSGRAREEFVGGYLCILPWIIGFLAFTAGPLVASLAISMMKWPGFGSMEYVGIRNWGTILNSRRTMQSFSASFKYAIMAVPLRIVLSLALAMLLNQDVKGRNFLRALFFMPSIVAGVATAFMWTLMFGTDFGVFNGLLAYLGVPRIPWLTEPGWAMRAFVLMSLWDIGGTMIIYLAGLKGIAVQYYEAAKIDGANAIQSFFGVTLPLITPTIFFSLTTGIIGALQVFTSAYLITEGGPLRATYFVVLYIYMLAFQSSRMGQACALAWLLFAVIVAITGIQFWMAKYWVYYEAATPE